MSLYRRASPRVSGIKQSRPLRLPESLRLPKSSGILKSLRSRLSEPEPTESPPERPSGPLRAHLTCIEVLSDLEGRSGTTPPYYTAVVYVDERLVVRSERVSAPRWKWPENCLFCFRPSSTIKIVIRQRSGHIYIIRRYTGKVVDLLENDATVDLMDNAGTRLAAKMKIKLYLVSYLTDTSKIIVKESTGVSAFKSSLQLTKNIIDTVVNPHPALKTSLAVMYSVRRVAHRVNNLQDTIRDLANSLGEVLGIAKECPTLLFINARTDVIEDISRTSLNIASLIDEVTSGSFARRLLNFILPKSVKFRIARCRNFLAVRVHNNLRALLANRANLVTYPRISASFTNAPGPSLEAFSHREFQNRSFGSILPHNLDATMQALWNTEPQSSALERADNCSRNSDQVESVEGLAIGSVILKDETSHAVTLEAVAEDGENKVTFKEEVDNTRVIEASEDVAGGMGKRDGMRDKLEEEIGDDNVSGRVEEVRRLRVDKVEEAQQVHAAERTELPPAKKSKAVKNSGRIKRLLNRIVAKFERKGRNACQRL